jgi:hypothetical protein
MRLFFAVWSSKKAGRCYLENRGIRNIKYEIRE